MTTVHVALPWPGGELRVAYDACFGAPFQAASAVPPGPPLVQVLPRDSARPTGPLRDSFGADGRLETRNFCIQRAAPDRVVVHAAVAPAVVTQAVRVAVEATLEAGGWRGFHASSVLVEGRAVLFAAASGTGKSTLAGRCEAAGLARLADESTLVRLDGGTALAAAHPSQLVGARFGEAFPLALVCLLERGEPGFARVSPAEAVAELLQSLFCHEEGLATARANLAFVAALAARVPVLRLRVPHDESAPVLVRQALSSAGATR